MACPGEGILTDIVRRLLDNTLKEVNYLRHFETHAHKFVQVNNDLITRRKKVQNDIEDAKNRNENQIENDVQDWIEEADNVIQENIKLKQTWSYGWCPCEQYQKGKMLAKRTLAIIDHIQKCNFNRVARPAELPGIKYHASEELIEFESRKAEFKQLVEALEDGNHYMIGLHGIGGTGKTTFAIQVGKQVEESKVFEKVIFVVVSNDPNVNRIRGDIARQLGLHLEQREEAEHSKLLWSRISNNERKLLIILDEVWRVPNLREIGIPYGPDHKNCYILIISGHLKLCKVSRCRPIVCLRTLVDEDALRLFLFHARSGDDDSSSSNDLEGLGRAFVKECGGLPIAIVALASTLRNWPVSEWNVALTNLKNSEPFVDGDEGVVYKCLRASYDNLNNEKTKKLFLLCSIFPRDYKIPINLIIRLGIGSGIFGEIHEYWATRSQVLEVKNRLIASSLLLKVEGEECVKMHGLVHRVALRIAKEDIQIIRGLRRTLEANKKFVFWSTSDFPDHSDATKLEILLLWISGNVLMNDPKALFARMTRLKVLFLLCEYVRKVPSPSLSQSLLSLKNIQALILDGWEIGDISVLKNLQSLVTLELKNCLINELPRDIKELKKLRLLGLRECEIQKNNPFKVIERCSQLEEIYFVENYIFKDWKPADDKEIQDEIAHDIFPPTLQMFSIASDGFECFTSSHDNGLLKCFNTKHVKNLMSKAMFKYLVGRAEVLELGKMGQTEWKSLVPDIIQVEDGGMNNLIKLYLHEWADIECLIDNIKHHYSTMPIFSKLVELHLCGVDLKELYWGIMPPGFLSQLQILKLNKCMKLQNIFSDENLKLSHLKVFELVDCRMFQPSIFQSSVAQNLVQLEELVIEGCDQLHSLIVYESLEEEMLVNTDQRPYGLLFPQLKSLQIEGCGNLEMVLSLLLAGDLPMLNYLCIRNCEKLKYIFGEYRDVGQILPQETMLPLLTEVHLNKVPSFINIFKKCQKYIPRSPHFLKEDSMEKRENSKTNAFSWARGCCFMASTKDPNIVVSNATLKRHTISQEPSASRKRIETFHTVECLMRQPLSLQHIRQMKLLGCPKLKSLFSVSIASTIMLEELEISFCEELKHVITNKVGDDDHLNYTSIFPKLQKLKVRTCNKLDFIFPSALPGGLQKLESIHIFEVDELKYVFGKYTDQEGVSIENENNEPYIDLPALETLSLQRAPNIISIGIKTDQPDCASLYTVEAPREIKKHMHDVTSEGAKESEIQEIVTVKTPLTPSGGFQCVINFHNLQQIEIKGCKKFTTLFSISACKNLQQLSKLTIEECEELVNVVEDDCNDHHHMNYSSIFPKLEDLSIWYCNNMEFIFPFSLFGCLQKLNSLRIVGVAELKYIFGKYDDGDSLSNENENNELQIHLPALKTLSFVHVPKMISNICAKKYHLRLPSLQSIKLGGLQEFNGGSFLDLMAYLQGIQLDVKAPKDLMNIVLRLTNIEVRDFRIEEFVNLDGVEIDSRAVRFSLEEMSLENLSELRHIWRGPKDTFRIYNLQTLNIRACKKLRTIFSGDTIAYNLSALSYLCIEDCDELVHIIEESVEDHSQKLTHSKLEQIHVKRCNSLKCLLSISTHFKLSNLKYLTIEEASKLKQVFISKKDGTENRVVKDVFPMLSELKLKRLPKLVAICEGIDFPTGPYLKVYDCPKYRGPSNLDSKNKATIEEQLSVHYSNARAVTYMEETSGSSNLVEITEETSMKIEAKDHTPPSDTSVAESELRGTSPPSEDEHKTSKSTMQLQEEDLGETKTTKASRKTKIPFDDDSIDIIVKERVQESPISNDVMLETVSADLAPSNLSAASVTTPPEEFSLSIGNIEEDTTTMEVKTAGRCFIYSQVEGSQYGPSTMSVEIIQEETTALEDTTDTMTIKDTVEQVFEENFAEDDVMTTDQPTSSNSRKQSAGPIDNLSLNDFALTIKETRDHSSVQEEDESEKPIKVTLPQVIPSLHQPMRESEIAKDDDVIAVGSTKTDSRKPSPRSIRFVTKEAKDSSVEEEHKLENPEKLASLPNVVPSLHHQTQSGDAGPSSISRISDILQFVELNDGEMALLAQALKQYPQLLLPHEDLTNRIIAFSYRVLVDILVTLSTKTSYTITSSEKSSLEANLREATFVGFDKDWVDSVRARVLGADMSDVLVAKEEIHVMEAELETCDIALEQVRKQREEAKEQLAVTRRQLEMEETEFEAIDSQMSGLLEDRKKLICRITEFREIIIAKDRPFGI